MNKKVTRKERTSETVTKDKKQKIKQDESFPFRHVYNLDLPAFLVQGLLEKNGVKEDPSKIQLKIVLQKNK